MRRLFSLLAVLLVIFAAGYYLYTKYDVEIIEFGNKKYIEIEENVMTSIEESLKKDVSDAVDKVDSDKIKNAVSDFFDRLETDKVENADGQLSELVDKIHEFLEDNEISGDEFEKLKKIMDSNEK